MDNIQLVEKLQIDKEKLFKEISKVIIGQKEIIEHLFVSLLCQWYLVWVSLLFGQALIPPARCARKTRPCLGLFYVKGTFRVSLFWWPPPAGAAAHPGRRRTYARTHGTHAQHPHDLSLSHFSTYRKRRRR